MKIIVSKDNVAHLAEQNDFKKFKVVVEGEKDSKRLSADFGDLFAGYEADHVWINEDALKRMLPSDEATVASFGAMIATARKYGWVNSEARTIRAHVEWVE